MKANKLVFCCCLISKDDMTGQVERKKIDEIGDNHVMTSADTPLRFDAFEMDDELKIELEEKFAKIMQILGLDLKDDSLKGTPPRVAKMYVKEIFSGLNPASSPKIAVFKNKFKYSEMLVERISHSTAIANITLYQS